MSTRGRTPAGRTATDTITHTQKQMTVHTEADAGAGHGKHHETMMESRNRNNTVTEKTRKRQDERNTRAGTINSESKMHESHMSETKETDARNTLMSWNLKYKWKKAWD